jgi:phytoene desaturase
VRIDVDGRRATGVTLEGGERLQADVVVSNADLPYTYAELLPPERAVGRMKDMKYTSSAIIFYWAVKGERSGELLHHNVFLADHRYRESFDTIFHDLSLPEEPSLYVCAPARTDPAFAPPVGDSLMALVPVGHLANAECESMVGGWGLRVAGRRRTKDEGRSTTVNYQPSTTNIRHSERWDKLRERARQAALMRLGEIGVRGLEERIVAEEVMDPARYLNELNLAKGAAFGLSHNFMQVGYLRPRNRHARYGNLYFAGASTHPGTGLPIVLISARLAVERVLSEQAPARETRHATQTTAQEVAG